ncbi:hypothetical protein HMPREF0321_0435 [Dermacoccus sp. Ellin185]|nr:hypothetical protein HMPREF0321_0435 [Dermacoccus sp. Ellin185]
MPDVTAPHPAGWGAVTSVHSRRLLVTGSLTAMTALRALMPHASPSVCVPRPHPAST